MTEHGEARIGRGAVLRLDRPMDGETLFWCDRDRAAEAIQAEPPGERLGAPGLAIEQHIVAAFGVCPEDHVEQRLALRRQQARIARLAGREGQDVLRQQALEEGPSVGATDPDECAIVKGGRKHRL